MKTLHKLFDNYEKWSPSNPTQIHQNVRTLADYVIPIYIQMMSDEDERYVVTEICTVLSEVFPVIGPQIAEGSKE